MTAAGSMTTADSNMACWPNMFPIHQNNHLSNSTPSLMFQHSQHQPLHSSTSSTAGNVSNK